MTVDDLSPAEAFHFVADTMRGKPCTACQWMFLSKSIASGLAKCRRMLPCDEHAGRHQEIHFFLTRRVERVMTHPPLFQVGL